MNSLARAIHPGLLRLLSVILVTVACVTSAHLPFSRAALAEAGSKPLLQAALLPALVKYTKVLSEGFATIPEDRKQKLEKLALFVRTKRAAGEPAKLTFVCTHNSRRSHMSQIWAAVAAASYGIDGVETFSGGIEVTAFNPRAVAAMQRAGLQIESPSGAGDNPHHRVTYAKNRPAIEAFSKLYSASGNPQDGFVAVMTCSHADKNCPSIQGASLRVAIPYEDPKVSDGTPDETVIYDQRVKQIATEMFYLFSRVGAAGA